ncbi:hypothetical protein Q9251_16135 [Alkalihalobacillus macyae]|uniref:hypothetical protein n=1 Tax=Guptibacillus hwajinpoensis TaxID=208199 RepID=UPI00273B73CC|nr:hypothetical protein [Alkalihalobacillus macyae]MDP4552406.1 hypothetical protein [Alkalihalobacillus macyae]
MFDDEKYTDFANVEKGRNYVLPEDTPEGPYGSPVNKKLGKTTPWREGQRSYSAFNYENKNLHQNLPRQDPASHPPHDDPEKDSEKPYKA